MPSDNQFRVQSPLYGGDFSLEETLDRPGSQLFVLPGELVQLDPLRLLEASRDRIAPHCIHFGACGGCHYQHIRYPAQLDLKSRILKCILNASFLPDPPPIQLYSAEEWQYRNRIRLRIAQTPAGELNLGYSRRGSNDFLPIRMCPIAAPLLWRAAEALLTLAAENPAHHRWLATVSEVELMSAGDDSRLQMHFFLNQPSPDPVFGTLCDHLKAVVPELAGAGAELNPDLNRRIRRRWSGLSWGAPGLTYRVAGRDYWVTRGAFFQVNRFLVDALVSLVADLAAAHPAQALAWDLFAGVGLFTRILAERFQRVIAVETGAVAAADLLAAARTHKRIEAIQSTTLDFLQARVLERERPSLIVLDPPRAGLGPEASTLLNRIAAPQIIYVSCDPVTLARDLGLLTRSYRIDALHLIDLFPQTFHLETVVHLTRR